MSLNSLSTLLAQPFLVWLLVPIAIIFIIYRQVFPQKVTLTSFVVLPILILYEVSAKQIPSSISQSDGLEFALTSLIAMISGMVQARVSSVSEREGGVFVRGGYRSLSAYAILAAGRLAVHLALGGGLAGFENNLWILWGTLGIEWCTRSVALCLWYPVVTRSIQTDWNTRRAKKYSGNRHSGQA